MPGYRHACCLSPCEDDGGGPPGGGFCEDGLGTIFTRSRVNGETVHSAPFTPPYVPHFFTVTLPTEMNLANVYPGSIAPLTTAGAFAGEPCIHPFGSDAVVQLCPGSPNPLVLRSNCSLAFYGSWPFATSVGTRYVIADAECWPTPEMFWTFVFSDQACGWGESGTDIGWPRPGKIWTRVELILPVIDREHKLWRLVLAKIAGVANYAWPTRVADEEEWAAAVFDREAEFLRGELAAPAVNFPGPWFWVGLRPYGNLEPVDEPCIGEQSHAPIYPLWYELLEQGGSECKERCVHCGEWQPVTIDGVSAQAGDFGQPPTSGSVRVLYTAPSVQAHCFTAWCKTCSVITPSGIGGDLEMNCLPQRVSLELPETINAAFREEVACGNWETHAPSPWSRFSSAPAVTVLEAQFRAGGDPYCVGVGAESVGGSIQYPWRNIVGPSSTNWLNSGLVVAAPYGTQLSCPTDALQRYVILGVGFVVTSPPSIPNEDRICRLFTICTINLMVERPWSVGGGFLSAGGAGGQPTMTSINLGPEFRLGDYYTPGGHLNDPIRTFALHDNAWNWSQPFEFERFYFHYLPKITDSCVDYSFPPEAYETSLARSNSGIALLADYCGQDTAHPVCARGNNHAYPIRVRPTLAETSAVRHLTVPRYCSLGALCAEPEPCEGGLLMMAKAAAPPSPTALETVDRAEVAARMAAHERAATERQRINRAICEACPSGLWTADHEYCEDVFKRCRCPNSRSRARAITITVQRDSNCPRGHFPKENPS